MKKTAKQPAKNSSARVGAIPAVPIEAVFSFLKGTKGTSSWTKQDFAGTLKISAADAAKILPVIQMQGYINPYHDEWVTTTAGEDVAGARPPRFSPEKVEEALAELRERIKATNQNAKSLTRLLRWWRLGIFFCRRRGCSLLRWGFVWSRGRRSAGNRRRNSMRRSGRF